MTSNLATTFSQLEGLSGNDRTKGYNTTLQQILSSGEYVADNLVAYVRSITSESVGVINSRPLLSAFVEKFRNVSNNDVKTDAG